MLSHGAVEHYALAPGRPETKQTKTRKSYRRFVGQLEETNGDSSRREELNTLIGTRRARLLQLAGENRTDGTSGIEQRLVRKRVHALRTSNRNKLGDHPSLLRKFYGMDDGSSKECDWDG